MNEDLLAFIAEELARLISKHGRLDDLSSELVDDAPAYIRTYLDHALASAGSALAVDSEKCPRPGEYIIDECRMIC